MANNSNSMNQRIFKELGFEIKPKIRCCNPTEGTKGTIKAEFRNPNSGNTYVYFVTDDGKETVLNKEAFREAEDDRKNHVWKLYRNSIKIGRIARSIVEASGEKVTDKEIETFVNLFKSHFDVLNNSLVVLPVTLYEVVATGKFHRPSEDIQCMDGYFPAFEAKEIEIHDSEEIRKDISLRIAKKFLKNQRLSFLQQMAVSQLLGVDLNS